MRRNKEKAPKPGWRDYRNSAIAFYVCALVVAEVFNFMYGHKEVLVQIKHGIFILSPVLMLVFAIINLKEDFRDHLALSVFVCIVSVFEICITEWVLTFDSPDIYNFIVIFIPLLVLSLLLGVFYRKNGTIAMALENVEITATIITFAVLILFEMLDCVIRNNYESSFTALFFAVTMVPLTLLIYCIVFYVPVFLVTLPFRLLRDL